jgi:hypothetical protein
MEVNQVDHEFLAFMLQTRAHVLNCEEVGCYLGWIHLKYYTALDFIYYRHFIHILNILMISLNIIRLH